MPPPQKKKLGHGPPMYTGHEIVNILGKKYEDIIIQSDNLIYAHLDQLLLNSKLIQCSFYLILWLNIPDPLYLNLKPVIIMYV